MGTRTAKTSSESSSSICEFICLLCSIDRRTYKCYAGTDVCRSYYRNVSIYTLALLTSIRMPRRTDDNNLTTTGSVYITIIFCIHAFQTR
jgi:hypothetical protein